LPGHLVERGRELAVRSSLACRYTLAAPVEEWPSGHQLSQRGARLTGEGVAGMTEIVNMNLSR
jgi:hypothetical protein